MSWLLSPWVIKTEALINVAVYLMVHSVNNLYTVSATKCSTSLE